jgi:hypothetical protein
VVERAVSSILSDWEVADYAPAELSEHSAFCASASARQDSRLSLPTVTLCAVTSVNLPATVAALRACLKQIDFAECLLFTDEMIPSVDSAIRVIPIPRIRASRGYSEFLLGDFVDHLRTDHCLIVQWDGFVLDSKLWRPEFLSYDYIGAPWPHFGDEHDVGNGGFSLRSRKLLEACRDPKFRACHPEDLAICRTNRSLLESEHGIRFADRGVAESFAFERKVPGSPTFGFHGIFNLISTLGPERFWEIYDGLDDRRTAFVDYRLLIRQLGVGRDALRRRSRLTADLLANLVRRRELRSVRSLG